MIFHNDQELDSFLAALRLKIVAASSTEMHKEVGIDMYPDGEWPHNETETYTLIIKRNGGAQHRHFRQGSS